MWNTLELDETGTTTAEIVFASCNSTNKKATDNRFVQKNNFSNACNRNSFSRTKRKNQIVMNGCRIENHEDQHVRKEELAKKGEANPDFIDKNNLTENSHPACWFKDFFLSNRA